MLSLSAVPNSMIMWAHYAENIAGAVLFIQLKKLYLILDRLYTRILTFEFGEFSDEDMSQAIQESLQFKRRDWAYENEWRLIQKDEADF